MSAPARPTVLYDGRCRFCRWCARVLLRLDRHARLAFLPLDDPAAVSLLRDVPRAEQLASWWLVQPNGTLARRAEAAIALLGNLGGPRLPAEHAPLATVADVAYRLVSARRGLLGRVVPDGPAPQRYP